MKIELPYYCVPVTFEVMRKGGRITRSSMGQERTRRFFRVVVRVELHVRRTGHSGYLPMKQAIELTKEEVIFIVRCIGMCAGIYGSAAPRAKMAVQEEIPLLYSAVGRTPTRLAVPLQAKLKQLLDNYGVPHA